MHTASEDLTTRARLRDAAIGCFASEGFDRTTLRQIAQAAGVSPALIVHHFGGKDGLREACDEFVVASIMDENDAVSGTAAAELMRTALDSPERRLPLLDYVGRMLTEPSSTSDRLFDAFLAGTRDMIVRQVEGGVMRPQGDIDAVAAFLTLYGLGPVLLQRHLARALGQERLTTELLERATIPVLEIFTHGLYADDRLLVAARDALRRTTGPRSDKGTNQPNQDPDPPQ